MRSKTKHAPLAVMSVLWMLVFTLVIGPLCAGSYFGAWRLPLLVTAALTSVLLLFVSAQKSRSYWVLVSAVALLSIQSIWMYFNAWGTFLGREPWTLSLLDDVPYPNLPGAADRAELLDRISYIFPCLLLVVGVRQLAIRYPSMIGVVAKTIFWTGTAMAILGLVQRWMQAPSIFWIQSLEYHNAQLFFGTYRSPGIATCYLYIALIMGLGCTLNSARVDESHRKVIPSLAAHFLALGTLTCAMISAGSKSGMLLGLLGILAWLIINRNTLKNTSSRLIKHLPQAYAIDRLVALGVICLIFILLLVVSVGTTVSRWQRAIDTGFDSLSSRALANRTHMEIINNEEWGALGFGPGSFYPLFPHFSIDQGDKLSGIWVYAHNDYLQTLIEWGWLGTACFTLIIGGGMALLAKEIATKRSYHTKERFVCFRGSLIAMCCLLLHATVEFPFQIESLAVTFSVLLGIAWASPALRGKETESRKSSSRES